MTTNARGMGHNDFSFNPEVKIDLSLVSMAYKVEKARIELALVEDGDIAQPAFYISDSNSYIDMITGEMITSDTAEFFIVDDVSYYNGEFTFKSGCLQAKISSDILTENFSSAITTF